MAKRRKLQTEVVGIAYRVTPYTRKLLARHAEIEPIKVVLKREPKNVHDENAIKVILDSTPFKGLHLGYVPRLHAAKLSPRMKLGTIVVKRAVVTAIRPEDGDGDLEISFVTRKSPKEKVSKKTLDK